LKGEKAVLKQDEQSCGMAIDETGGLSTSSEHSETLRPPANSGDETLMQQMQSGYANALSILFAQYHRLVFTVARRILRDSTEAEDLTQDVFIEIYRKAHLYDSRKGSVKTWVLQYAYHRSFNRRKHLSLAISYNASEATLLEYSGLHDNGGWDRLLGYHDWRDALVRGMKGLNYKERAIIESVSFEGLTLREASARLRVSYVNGRNHYYRGLKKLKKSCCPAIGRVATGLHGAAGELRCRPAVTAKSPAP